MSTLKNSLENLEPQYYNEAMSNAAMEGHLEVVKLCKEYGASDYDSAMSNAAWSGHVEVVKSM